MDCLWVRTTLTLGITDFSNLNFIMSANNRSEHKTIQIEPSDQGVSCATFHLIVTEATNPFNIQYIQHNL